MQSLKGKIYTAVMVTVSLGIVLGGWFLTRKLLDKKEEEFLGGTGAVSLRFEQTALLAQEEAQERANAFKEQKIPEALMKELLLLWDYAGKEMPHEPKEEQMNMEQAIETGKQWITVLAEHEIVPGTLKDGDFDKITAQLSTVETQTSLNERLLSRWTLEFIKDDVDIKLMIHAMSGEVWYANISMMAYSSKAYEYSLEEILDLMFPRVAEGDAQTLYYSEYQMQKLLEEKLVSAEIIFLVKGAAVQSMPSYEIAFWLNPMSGIYDTDEAETKAANSLQL